MTTGYRIHSHKRRGAYFIFHASNLALTQGRCSFVGGVYLQLGRDKEEERLWRRDFCQVNEAESRRPNSKVVNVFFFFCQAPPATDPVVQWSG